MRTCKRKHIYWIILKFVKSIAFFSESENYYLAILGATFDDINTVFTREKRQLRSCTRISRICHRDTNYNDTKVKYLRNKTGRVKYFYVFPIVNRL